MRYFISALILSLAIISIWSCDEGLSGGSGSGGNVSAEDSLSSILKVNEANDALEDIFNTIYDMEEPDSVSGFLDAVDFSTAYDLYIEAQTFNPNNHDANFGVAMTGLMEVTQDPSFRELATNWENYFVNNTPFMIENGRNSFIGRHGFGLPLSFESMRIPITPFIAGPLTLAKMTIDDVPQFSELQVIIRTILLPIVDQSIASLAAVETDTTFTFDITAQMQPDSEAESMELDLTEVYAIDMMLQVVKAVCNTTIAYNFDFVSFDGAGIEAELTRGSDFATLNSSGAQDLSNAYTAMTTAINKLEQGIDFLENETDNQSNDIIPNTELSSSDFVEIRDGIEIAQNAISEPTWVNIDCWDNDVSPPDSGRSTLGCDSVQVDIKQFFTEPIDDFKEMIPPYSVSADTSHDWNYIDYLDGYWNYEYEYVTFNLTVNTDDDYYFEYNKRIDPLGVIETDIWTDGQGFEVPQEVINAVDQKLNDLLSSYGSTYMIEVYVYWYGFLVAGDYEFEQRIRWYVDIVELESSWEFPVLTWDANTYTEWKNGWPDPTFNGVFPDWTVDDFLDFLRFTEEDWEKILNDF